MRISHGSVGSFLGPAAPHRGESRTSRHGGQTPTSLERRGRSTVPRARGNHSRAPWATVAGQDNDVECTEHRVHAAAWQTEGTEVGPRKQRLRHRQPLVKLALPLGHETSSRVGSTPAALPATQSDLRRSVCSSPGFPSGTKPCSSSPGSWMTQTLQPSSNTRTTGCESAGPDDPRTQEDPRCTRGSAGRTGGAP